MSDQRTSSGWSIAGAIFCTLCLAAMWCLSRTYPVCEPTPAHVNQPSVLVAKLSETDLERLCKIEQRLLVLELAPSGNPKLMERVNEIDSEQKKVNVAVVKTLARLDRELEAASDDCEHLKRCCMTCHNNDWSRKIVAAE
jgi:hypothetical protein